MSDLLISKQREDTRKSMLHNMHYGSFATVCSTLVQENTVLFNQYPDSFPVKNLGLNYVQCDSWGYRYILLLLCTTLFFPINNF